MGLMSYRTFSKREVSAGGTTDEIEVVPASLRAAVIVKLLRAINEDNAPTQVQFLTGSPGGEIEFFKALAPTANVSQVFGERGIFVPQDHRLIVRWTGNTAADNLEVQMFGWHLMDVDLSNLAVEDVFIPSLMFG